MDQIAAAPMLPMGFADQVMDLEIKLDEEESLELIQILIQMYQVSLLISRLQSTTILILMLKKLSIFRTNLIN